MSFVKNLWVTAFVADRKNNTNMYNLAFRNHQHCATKPCILAWRPLLHVGSSNTVANKFTGKAYKDSLQDYFGIQLNMDEQDHQDLVYISYISLYFLYYFVLHYSFVTLSQVVEGRR